MDVKDHDDISGDGSGDNGDDDDDNDDSDKRFKSYCCCHHCYWCRMDRIYIHSPLGPVYVAGMGGLCGP